MRCRQSAGAWYGHAGILDSSLGTRDSISSHDRPAQVIRAGEQQIPSDLSRGRVSRIATQGGRGDWEKRRLGRIRRNGGGMGDAHATAREAHSESYRQSCILRWNWTNGKTRAGSVSCRSGSCCSMLDARCSCSRRVAAGSELITTTMTTTGREKCHRNRHVPNLLSRPRCWFLYCWRCDVQFQVHCCC